MLKKSAVTLVKSALHKILRGLPQWIALFVSGCAVGWLIGLSASAVLQILVAGVLTLVVGVISALTGIEAPSSTVPDEDKSDALPTSHHRSNRRIVTPVPLALCLLGIISGTSVGVYGRTHEWLGADPQSLARKWRVTGLSDQEIARRLFNQIYPPATLPAKNDAEQYKPEGEQNSEKTELKEGNNLSGTHQGALFSDVPAGECVEFKSLSGPDLRRLMLASQNERVRRFAQQCRDYAALKAAVENLICQGGT